MRSGRAPEHIERLLSAQPWSLLEPALGPGADGPAIIARLREFARMVIAWNNSASNVISRNDERRIVDRHFLESIAPATWLRESGCTRWVDLGSGAGFPAIPLVIAGVGGSWTLVESRRSKTLFLRKATETFHLDGVQIENARMEDLVIDDRLLGAFDGFTSRATMRLGPTLALATRLVAPGGNAFLWKGSGLDEEMVVDASWRAHWDHVESRAIKTGPVAVARFIRRTID